MAEWFWRDETRDLLDLRGAQRAFPIASLSSLPKRSRWRAVSCCTAVPAVDLGDAICVDSLYNRVSRGLHGDWMLSGFEVCASCSTKKVIPQSRRKGGGRIRCLVDVSLSRLEQVEALHRPFHFCTRKWTTIPNVIQSIPRISRTSILRLQGDTGRICEFLRSTSAALPSTEVPIQAVPWARPHFIEH